MSWPIALAVLLLGGGSPARAELGAMLGIRKVSLAGDIRDEGTVSYAVAGVVMHELPHGLAVGSEPGIRRSGSNTYRMFDLVIPLVGRFTLPIGGAHRLRASVAFMPAYRLSAQHEEAAENGYEWIDLDGVRGWDLDLAGGFGYEHATSTRRFFAELRLASSLVTVDVDAMPLAIYRRELGVWVGVSR